MKMPTIFPSKTRLLSYLAIVCIYIVIKIPLALNYAIEEMSGDNFQLDVMERREFLVDKVIKQRLTIDDMPVLIGHRFRGEWMVGTYSMFAAALTNIAFLYPETRQETLPMVKELIRQMLRKETRQFDIDGWNEDPMENLKGVKGHIGYLGHLAWIMSAYKLLGGADEFDVQFEDVIASLRQSIRDGVHHCAETYPQERYVSDNIVVLAALGNYDRIKGFEDDGEIAAWRATAKAHLIDPATELLYFSLNPDGSPRRGSRGSSSGWNSFYLPFFDEQFAIEQFAKLKRNLRSQALGYFTGIREFPRGVFGIGDVDSGPVILGLSPAGTGFSVAGARLNGDEELFVELLATAEAAGTTISIDGKRRYFWAPLVGDAIMLAMKTATPWDLRYSKVAK